MKRVLEVILKTILLLALLFGIAWCVHWVIASFPQYHAPVCTKWENRYYWENWMGDRHFVGTEPEEALKLSGGRALIVIPECITTL